MKREFNPDEPELMDLSQPVPAKPKAEPAELQAELAQLRLLNRYFGSYRLIRAFLRCWLQPGRPYRVLDLATGSGDIPRMMVDWARPHCISLRIDAVDAQPSTLQVARELSAGYPEITFLRGDLRTFEDPGTYDLVLCSQALHHFSAEEAVGILRRMRLLSHDKILVADLERSVFSRCAVWLVTSTLLREPFTVHDARLSVRRAFSYRELETLAAEAGWSNFGHRRFFPARQALWLRTREVAPIPISTTWDFAT